MLLITVVLLFTDHLIIRGLLNPTEDQCGGIFVVLERRGKTCRECKVQSVFFWYTVFFVCFVNSVSFVNKDWNIIVTMYVIICICLMM